MNDHKKLLPQSCRCITDYKAKQLSGVFSLKMKPTRPNFYFMLAKTVDEFSFIQLDKAEFQSFS